MTEVTDRENYTPVYNNNKMFLNFFFRNSVSTFVKKKKKMLEKGVNLKSFNLKIKVCIMIQI